MNQETQTITEVKRYSPKTEIAVLKALNKLLSSSTNHISEEAALKLNHCAVMDAANVCLVQAKTEEAKRCLSRYVGERETKVPDLKYIDIGKPVSKYNVTYMKNILGLCDATSETATVSIGYDYPGTWETADFKIILAPRVDRD